jgi:hypothetical protein
MKRLLLTMVVALLADRASAQLVCSPGSPDYPACLFKKSRPKTAGPELNPPPPSPPVIPSVNMQQMQRPLDPKSFGTTSGKIIVN